MAREMTTERCPACERTGTVESYGEHPVYPAPQHSPLDVRVAVLVCRECGHVQLRQVV